VGAGPSSLAGAIADSYADLFDRFPSTLQEDASLIRQASASPEVFAEEFRSGGFVDLKCGTMPWRRRYAIEEWTGLLGTDSWVSLLPLIQRRYFLRSVARNVLVACGDSIEMTYSLNLVTGFRE
jgi:hypothetical protein